MGFVLVLQELDGKVLRKTLMNKYFIRESIGEKMAGSSGRLAELSAHSASLTLSEDLEERFGKSSETALSST